MKQQIAQHFSATSYLSQQQQHQQYQQKSLSNNQQFHPSYQGMPPNLSQNNYQNQYLSRTEDQLGVGVSHDQSLLLQANSLNYTQQQPVYSKIKQNQHQEQMMTSEQQIASNLQQMSLDHLSYLVNHSNKNSHLGQHQQQTASRFYAPHNLGFYQNNQQQDMSIQQSNYQQQQQQIQINQQFITSQTFSTQNYQLNQAQINEKLSSHQLQDQSNDQKAQSKYQYQQQQQQQPIYQQNSNKSYQTTYDQNADNEQQYPEKGQQQQQQHQQLEEQGNPSSVLLVIAFELRDLQITNDQLQQIFSPYGFVNKVLIFQKNTDSTKAFIEMDSVESAKKAKEALNRAKIPLLPNQKYKFKVHYSQTTDLNLCNYKTEGKDYRLSSNKNTNQNSQNQISSSSNSISLDGKFQQQKLQAKTFEIKYGIQSANSQCNTNKSYGNLEQEKQFINLQRLPSSQSSIPSPKNNQNNNLNMKTPNTQNRTYQSSHNSHGFKNISNSIGQTIGAITYIEKSSQNSLNQEEQFQQQLNTTVAPPNIANPITSNFVSQSIPNNQFPVNSQLISTGIQPYSNSLQSLTSTSTPTSQSNINLGGSLIHNKITSSQTNIGSIRNESATYFSPVTFQIQGGLGFNQQQSEDNGNRDEGDCFKSPFDQKCEISNTGNSNAITTSKTANIGKGDTNNRQGSCSMLPTKLESFESFNQIQEQGSTSIQNLPEFNLQLAGQQNINNPSNLSQSLTDISPRKGSLVFLNSDLVTHQLSYQESYYQQSINSQFSQVLQQKDYKIPSQPLIGPQSMIDITQNSKSTCSTSSPSPFHTSHIGLTSPSYPNSCKINPYQQITRLDSLQLNQVDLSSNQFINTSHTQQGFINNHLTKQISNPSQKQQQQLLIQQQPHQFPISTPLIQENSLDQSFSSGIAFSNNNFQDDVLNNSPLKSKSSLQNQLNEQNENCPLQTLSHLGQQQQTEESPVIYVKNIKINEVTPENVYNIFRNFGYVHSILFLREKKTVLIQYEELGQAKMAINQLNNMSFQGDEQMRISYAKHKTIIIKQNQGSKINQQQSQQNDKNQKQSDYFVNKYNDPRSRAGCQNNKKNNFYNPVSKTVYVTNIPLQLIKKELEFLNIFKPYGLVTRYDISKQDKKVTAFVEFDTFQSALNAICFLHNTQHYGKLIQIFFTRSMIK